MSDIRAIETEYRGFRFRSRTEARWAVFFDTCGIPFEYEKEGFELSGGIKYLPDFWIPLAGDPPGSGYWLEIKGAAPTEDEKRKCHLLAVGTGDVVYLVAGPPGEHLYWKWYRDGRLIWDGRSSMEAEGYEPELHFWCTARVKEDAPFPEAGVDAARAARFERPDKSVVQRERAEPFAGPEAKREWIPEAEFQLLSLLLAEWPAYVGEVSEELFSHEASKEVLRVLYREEKPWGASLAGLAREVHSLAVSFSGNLAGQEGNEKRIKRHILHLQTERLGDRHEAVRSEMVAAIARGDHPETQRLFALCGEIATSIHKNSLELRNRG